MKALVFERKELKYAAASIGSRVLPGVGSAVGPLSLKILNRQRFLRMGGKEFSHYCRVYVEVIWRL